MNITRNLRSELSRGVGLISCFANWISDQYKFTQFRKLVFSAQKHREVFLFSKIIVLHRKIDQVWEISPQLKEWRASQLVTCQGHGFNLEEMSASSQNTEKILTSGWSWLASLNITAASRPVALFPGGLRLCFLTIGSSAIDYGTGVSTWEVDDGITSIKMSIGG